MRALADRVGVSKVTIWKWERGDNEPRTRHVALIAKALDVTPAHLRLPAATGHESVDSANSGLPGPMKPAAKHRELSAEDPAETLSEVIAKAKQMIADASGTGLKNITISIEY